jgi:hypothetical protein
VVWLADVNIPPVVSGAINLVILIASHLNMNID